MIKSKTIPAIRLPKFEDQWIEQTVGEIADVKSLKYNPMRGKEPVKCIELEHIESETGQLLGYSDGQTLGSMKNVFKEGDILFGKLRPYLKKYLCAPFDGVCSSEIWVLKSKNGMNAFLYYAVQTDTFIDLTSISSGSKMPRADWNVVSKGTLFFPSLPEQQKIASFLTAVDDKIRQLSKKKILLEQYKKGLMQQIFSREIRFKDDRGNKYPNWEQRKLGDVVDFISTNSFSRSLLNYDEGFVRNIHYGDIHTKFKIQFRAEREKVPFINSDVNISSIVKASYCREGDLIIADASEDYKDVGKAIEVISTGNEKLLAGLHTYIARDKENYKTALGFKGYLMQTASVRKQIMTMAVGISVLGISKVNLGKVNIHIPVLEEQTKITTFLSAIDDKINYVSKQIEQTKQFKKGLLQQMFV